MEYHNSFTEFKIKPRFDLVDRDASLAIEHLKAGIYIMQILFWRGGDGGGRGVDMADGEKWKKKKI